MVFYQHKNMNYRNHGAAEYEEKEMNKRLEKVCLVRRNVALVTLSI